MIVLDASAAVDLLLRREAHEAIAEMVFRAGEVLHAPHLLDVEVLQVFRRLERAGPLKAGRGAEALDDLRALRIIRHSHLPLLDRVWTLRRNVSAYDAVYIALAESLDAPLVTLDDHLARAPGHEARVVVL